MRVEAAPEMYTSNTPQTVDNICYFAIINQPLLQTFTELLEIALVTRSMKSGFHHIKYSHGIYCRCKELFC